MSDDATYRLKSGPPDVSDFLRLRNVSGLSPYAEEAVKKGLRGGLHSVVVYKGDEAVGMGRIVGDGGTVFHIVDIAVVPAHQRRGLGRMIMQALTDWLDENAPESAYINLLADVPADKLYEQFRFRPTGDREIGMAYKMKKSKP